MRKIMLLSKINIQRDLLLLLMIGGLYSLGIFLSNTFVNVYLWKQSGEYHTIAIYNLAIYIAQPLIFVLAGKLAKKIERIIVLRLGVIFLSLFFLSVLLIGEKVGTYNYILGTLLGIGYGFYWLAFNVLTFEITEPDTRDFFNGFLGMLQSFGGMIGPLLAGIVIAKMSKNSGYTVIFTVSFILFVCAVIFSFFLKRRQADGKFELIKVVKERHVNKNWQRIIYSHVFQGLREGMFLFVITIWVYVVTKSEFSLGIFNFVLSGVSIVFYFISIKFIKSHLRKKAILYGGILLYLAIYIIIFKMTYLHLLIYAVVIGIAHPIINVPYVSMTYDVIGRARFAKELRVEYIVVRELFVNLGRVISILIFIAFITIYEAEKVIPLLIIIFGAGHLFVYPLIKNIHLRPYQKEVMVKEQLSDEKNR